MFTWAFKMLHSKWGTHRFQKGPKSPCLMHCCLLLCTLLLTAVGEVKATPPRWWALFFCVPFFVAFQKVRAKRDNVGPSDQCMELNCVEDR